MWLSKYLVNRNFSKKWMAEMWIQAEIFYFIAAVTPWNLDTTYWNCNMLICMIVFFVSSNSMQWFLQTFLAKLFHFQKRNFTKLPKNSQAAMVVFCNAESIKVKRSFSGIFFYIIHIFKNSKALDILQSVLLWLRYLYSCTVSERKSRKSRFQEY